MLTVLQRTKLSRPQLRRSSWTVDHIRGTSREASKVGIRTQWPRLFTAMPFESLFFLHGWYLEATPRGRFTTAQDICNLSRERHIPVQWLITIEYCSAVWEAVAPTLGVSTWSFELGVSPTF